MTARVLKITGRRRRDPLAVVSADDFRLQDAGPADAGAALRDPCLSLYCLDIAAHRALYVRTPGGPDLAREPLLYQAQYRLAEHVVAIGLDELYALADDLPDPGSPLVLLYSVGRCGSTLLSRAFERAGCVSLSEPDVFTQLLTRDASPTQAALQLRRLTRVLLGGPAGRRRVPVVVKFRAMAIEQAAAMHAAFPHARRVFLYRDAGSVVRSGMAAFCRFGSDLWWLQHLSRWAPLRPLLRHRLARDRATLRAWFPCIDLFTSRELSRMGAVGLLAVSWLSAMHRYLDLHAAGAGWTALRYEDLVAHPEPLLRELFGICGIPEARVGAACGALLEDSQHGSSLARSSLGTWRLRDRDRETIAAVLARHPAIATPGFVLPGTLMPR